MKATIERILFSPQYNKHRFILCLLLIAVGILIEFTDSLKKMGIVFLGVGVMGIYIKIILVLISRKNISGTASGTETSTHYADGRPKGGGGCG